MKCPNCGSTDIDTDSSRGDSACTQCGTIMAQNAIVSEIGFVEGANGASSVLGQFVPSTGGNRLSASAKTRGPGGRGPSVSYQKDSREHTIQNGRKAIQQVADHLRLRPHHVDSAVRLFMLAVQHNFIQGRRTAHVVSACLYIVCRREKTPHLLIDFSDVLQINLYVLGATFLKFIRLLNLSLPIIDPSLYIHRFAAQLELKDEQNRDKTHMVAMTALRLVARMKRDWMLVGRRPSGICGASLLIAARIHGFRRTQKEIIFIVRVCDLTLRKRLLEFSNTASSQLTLEEFESMDVELITNSKALIEQQNREALARDPNALLKADPFGREMDPPAFTRNRMAEREDMAQAIRQQKAKLVQIKEELLSDLQLTAPKPLPLAAAAATPAGLLLPGTASEETARDREIRAIQSESRALLEAQPGVSDSIVQQIEEMIHDRRTGFAELDEGPQREVLSGKDADTDTRVHVTPMTAPLPGAAAAAASSSSAAAAASPATAAPSQTRLKSIHKGPNLSSSRSRRTAGAGQAPATPQLHSSILKGRDAPPMDLASLLPPTASGAPADLQQLVASTGNPLADAMLVASSDPSLQIAGAGAGMGLGIGAHATVSAFLESTVVDPDPANWTDLAALDDEIDDSAILLTEEEAAFKTRAWEEINKDYLQEQEEKKAMLLAAASAAGQTLGPDGQPLPRRQYKKKSRNAPAATPAEAAMRLLAEKKYSDKINYNALQGLLARIDDKPKKKEDQQPVEEEDDEDDDVDDSDDDAADDDDDEEEGTPRKGGARSGHKRGVSSISAQLPSAKQQRRGDSDDDDDGAGGGRNDEDDDDGADDGGGGDDDDY